VITKLGISNAIILKIKLIIYKSNLNQSQNSSSKNKIFPKQIKLNKIIKIY